MLHMLCPVEFRTDSNEAKYFREALDTMDDPFLPAWICGPGNHGSNSGGKAAVKHVDQRLKYTSGWVLPENLSSSLCHRIHQIHGRAT